MVRTREKGLLAEFATVMSGCRGRTALGADNWEANKVLGHDGVEGVIVDGWRCECKIHGSEERLSASAVLAG
jgi:hypothetical protein